MSKNTEETRLEAVWHRDSDARSRLADHIGQGGLAHYRASASKKQNNACYHDWMTALVARVDGVGKMEAQLAQREDRYPLVCRLAEKGAQA